MRNMKCLDNDNIALFNYQKCCRNFWLCRSKTKQVLRGNARQKNHVIVWTVKLQHLRTLLKRKAYCRLIALLYDDRLVIITMAAKIAGEWKIKNSENFDEYMKALGVNIAMRKMGNLAKPILTIAVDGNSFTMKSVSTFRNLETKCTLGEEFDEETPDGRKCKTSVREEGEKVIQHQKWGDKETTITRYMQGDELVMDLVMGSVVAKRVYVKNT